jgi:hypothetical protein
MSLVRRESIESPGADPVVFLRSSRRQTPGFIPQIADPLARDYAYDLHAVLGLVDRGCPAELAARILAPLDGQSRPR